MPICVDDRATNGVPFTFIYSAIFKRLRLRLPFTFFEKDLLTELNVAPCQLHPNAWAFIRAFEIDLAGDLSFEGSATSNSAFQKSANKTTKE